MSKADLELKEWGTLEEVPMSEGHEVLQFTVNPGARLPVRVNDYQCEHWVIVKGIGRVNIDHRESLVDEGASVFVPARAGHSIENLGQSPLRIVAIHYGPEWPTDGNRYSEAREAAAKFKTAYQPQAAE